MKAAVTTGPGQIEIHENLPKPQFKEGVLVCVKTTGFCATDVKMIRGLKPGMKYPMIFGHEFSGIVAESTIPKYKNGDRISVAPFCGCGHCYYCLNGEEQFCLNKSVISSGSTAEFDSITPRLAFMASWLMPDEVTWDEGALCEPLACVILSLRSCGFRPGESVLVMGAGVMGQLHVLLSKAWGASHVMVCEPDPVRRQMAKNFGADVIDPTNCENVGEWVRSSLGGRGPDIIIAAAGVKAVADAAIKAAGIATRIHLFGGMPHDTVVEISAFDIHYKRVTLLGTSGFRSVDLQCASDMIKGHTIDLSKIVTHRFSVDRAMEAFNMAQKPEALKVMMDNSEFPNQNYK